MRKMMRWFVCVCLAVLAAAFSVGAAFAADTEINEKNFPDDEFREWVLTNVDRNGDERLNTDEIISMKEMTIYSSPIESLKGIEFFTNLEYLDFVGEISGRLDLRKNVNLYSVKLGYNEYLTSVDVSGCAKLGQLYISNCALRRLDVSKNTNLVYLDCSCNMISSLNLANNTKLEYLNCSANLLLTLDVSKQTKLEELYCDDTYLQTLDVRNCAALKTLSCGRSAISELKFGAKNTALQSVFCTRNQLLALDVSALPALVKLDCYGNRLTDKTLKLNSTLTALRNDPDSLFQNSAIEMVDTSSAYGDFNYELGLPVLVYLSSGAGAKGHLAIDYVPPLGQAITLTFFRSVREKAVYVTYTSGKEYTIPKIEYSASSVVYFLGWALAPGAREPQFKSGDKVTLYRNTILYPVLKAKLAKVTYDLNGGTAGAPATEYVDQIVPYEIPSSSPVWEGYYFCGWKIKDSENERIYKSGNAVEISQNTVFSAVWQPRTNTITFHANGGSGTLPSEIKVLSGKEATIPKVAMTRAGYWFLGWSTSANATAASYKSGDKLSVTKDTVLYAVWKSKGYTLTFDANGGSGEPSVISAEKNSTVTIPKANVTREGYWFLGWATSKTATSAQYKSGSQLTLSANMTLYAVWKKK